MSELSFLSAFSSPVEVFKAAILGGPLVEKLTQAQIEKIKRTTAFLLKTDETKRKEVLTSLQCPEEDSIVEFISKYQEILRNGGVNHNLVDFDWSTSIILGTSKVSNLKEPIATFRFKLEDGSNPAIELTADEAEELLKQLEAAKSAQAALLPN